MVLLFVIATLKIIILMKVLVMISSIDIATLVATEIIV
jgi:hypothetical protein